MPDPSLADVFSIAKDTTITGLLVWALQGVFKRKWVPGDYYFDQVKRAETAEAERRVAVETTNRTVKVNEELVQILRDRERC